MEELVVSQKHPDKESVKAHKQVNLQLGMVSGENRIVLTSNSKRLSVYLFFKIIRFYNIKHKPGFQSSLVISEINCKSSEFLIYSVDFLERSEYSPRYSDGNIEAN